jgi:hypothetical protein
VASRPGEQKVSKLAAAIKAQRDSQEAARAAAQKAKQGK